MLKKQYISFDVEASGPIPSEYSMLSLGACVVGDVNQQFYRELQPINFGYKEDALKIGCLELDLLTKRGDEFDSRSPSFDSRRTLELLMDEGIEPLKAMSDYRDWLSDVKNSNSRLIEAAAPIGFDRQFSNWYFHNYLDSNPFGNRSEDMNSMYRGVTGNIDSSLSDLNVEFENPRKHNALQDAIYQAKQFEIVLEMMRNN